MQKLFPDCTFEIINFDTKGDQILNIALPKIGDKGLFTKELEDGLENGSIDFVVHSLKDMPCQTMPEKLILCGIPVREDPRDALVMAKRHEKTKFSLDDLDDYSVIGTSSLRRISQLKLKYPKLKFETIRGNLQTRFAKLDDEANKFDAIILAAAGLNRLDYQHRITQYLSSEICMHAVSQGALGIQSRRDDLEMIKMINNLNDEATLLRCIAERTFLAALEGGCSAPVGVFSKLTENSIFLEGAVFDLEGTVKIADKFEISFDSSATLESYNCPILPTLDDAQKAVLKIDNKLLTDEDKAKLSESKSSDINKRHHSASDEDETKNINESLLKKIKSAASKEPFTLKYYSFIADLNISENKLIKAELCGLHLAQKLKEKGADVLINECKAIIGNKMN